MRDRSGYLRGSSAKLRGRQTIVLIILAATWAATSGAPQARADSIPAATPLPRDTLAGMYRTELGPLFHSNDLPRLYTLHMLLEEYFSATGSAERKRIVADIDAMGMDRAVIGRMARLRMNWQPLTPGVYYVNEKIGPHDVRYFLGVPRGYDVARPWPLVVKLPVANAFLTQPPPDAGRVAQIYTQWIEAELSAHGDALVLMPLLNLDELYGPGPVGMNLVMQPILDAAGKANVDPSRVYLIGHSMAAHAVWNIAIHYPTYFAAINPMAGSVSASWQRFRLGDLCNILCVVWHDVSDTVVNVNESREPVRYLAHMKYDVDYLETQNIGHAPTVQIVEEEYAKVRARQRDLYPREVFLQSNSPDTIFNRADWVQIYQPISPGEQVKVEFSRGSQGMYLYQNGFRVVADLMGSNTISMTARNVQLVRLYLNDQMVDLSKPVKVVVNNQMRFDGLVGPSTSEMLSDQLFLGRGWRYYTAVIDLDLTQSPATAPSTQPKHHGTIEYVGPDGKEETFVPK